MGGEEEVKVVVGYALEAKKVESFIKASLLSHGARRGIRFVAVDLRRPLIEQGPFHCLIHKLYGADWNRQLLDFQSQHPDVVIVDSPDDILRLHDRTSMLDAVSAAAASHSLPITIPKQILLLDQNSDLSTTFSFPAIAKPLAANGGAACHEMSLVFDAEGLRKVEPPVVVQEFVNHGGVLFKVYVAGDHVRCVNRPSLPDVSIQGAAEGTIIPFSQVSNLPADSSAVAEVAEVQPPPPDELINELARGLRQELKLNLFNLDIIRDSKNDKYVVIDINYFPGYSKLPDFESFFIDFLSDITQTRS